MSFINNTIEDHSSIDDTLDYIKSLKETQYKWWLYYPYSPNEPSYSSNGEVPPNSYIRSHGINCVGVINLMRRYNNRKVPGCFGEKPEVYTGGPFIWFDYLHDRGVLHKFDATRVYPKGTLLLRKYKDRDDHGHIAVIYQSDARGVLHSSLLHSYSYDSLPIAKLCEPGVCIDDCVGMSHYWKKGGFYTHVCKLDDWLYTDD
jgi:hypothetical protein